FMVKVSGTNISVNIRISAYTPALVSSPPNMAAIAEGGVWYDEGSQKYIGNTAALIPKPIKNSMAVTLIRPRLGTWLTFRERSAIFRLPVRPYRIAIAVRKMTDANRFMVTYLIAPSICGFSPPSVINTKDEMMMISNHTYRLKIS